MTRIRFSVLIVLLALSLPYHLTGADQRVTLTITVTNLPVTSNTLVFSAPAAKTLTWTNVAGSANVVTGATIAASTTNLFFQVSAYAIGIPRLAPNVASLTTNSFQLVGEVNQTIAVTSVGTGLGNWCSITLATSTVTRLTTVRVPIASEIGDTNRTNVGSLLVLGISDFSTNAFGSNSVAMRHYMSLGTNEQQALGKRRFEKFDTSTNVGKLYYGETVGLTNRDSVLTNSELQTLIIKRGLTADSSDYGIHFWLAGTPTSKILAGGGDGYPQLQGTSGFLNISADPDENHILNYGSAIRLFPTLAAVASVTSNYWTVPNRFSSTVYAATVYPVAVHAESLSVSNGLTATNAVLRHSTYYGSNNYAGDVAYTPYSIASLANGNNIAAPLTNSYVYVSGPTTNFTICGIQGGYEGRELRIENVTLWPLTLAHESGVDPTAANRISTPFHADVTVVSNGFARLEYRGSRWRVESVHPATAVSTNSLAPGGNTQLLYNNGNVVDALSGVTTDSSETNVAVTGLLKAGKLNVSLVLTQENATASRVAIYNGSKELTNSTVTTTEMGYLSGVTSAVQTQLNEKGYTLTLGAAVAGSPADSTTYLTGGDWASSVNTVWANVRVRVPRSGTVKAYHIKARFSSAGSTETVSHYIRLNDTTDFGQVDATWDATAVDVVGTGLSQGVTAGDYIAIKIVTPAWATNPLGFRPYGVIYIE